MMRKSLQANWESDQSLWVMSEYWRELEVIRAGGVGEKEKRKGWGDILVCTVFILQPPGPGFDLLYPPKAANQPGRRDTLVISVLEKQRQVDPRGFLAKQRYLLGTLEDV